MQSHRASDNHWTFTLDEKELAPGKSASFITRLSSPPPEARDLEVRFLMKGDDLQDSVPPISPAAETPPASDSSAAPESGTDTQSTSPEDDNAHPAP